MEEIQLIQRGVIIDIDTIPAEIAADRGGVVFSWLEGDLGFNIILHISNLVCHHAPMRLPEIAGPLN